MAVGKLIFLILIFGVIYLIFRSYSGSMKNRPQQRGEAGVEDMVRCERCGVHLPRSESVTSQGRFYCCDEHRRLGSG